MSISGGRGCRSAHQRLTTITPLGQDNVSSNPPEWLKQNLRIRRCRSQKRSNFTYLPSNASRLSCGIDNLSRVSDLRGYIVRLDGPLAGRSQINFITNTTIQYSYSTVPLVLFPSVHESLSCSNGRLRGPSPPFSNAHRAVLRPRLAPTAIDPRHRQISFDGEQTTPVPEPADPQDSRAPSTARPLPRTSGRQRSAEPPWTPAGPPHAQGLDAGCALRRRGGGLGGVQEIRPAPRVPNKVQPPTACRVDESTLEEGTRPLSSLRSDFSNFLNGSPGARGGQSKLHTSMHLPGLETISCR